MAEIPVERKSSSKAWLWILLALAVVALLIWWATSGDDEYVAGPADIEATEGAPAVAPITDPMATTGAPDAGGDMTIAAVLANPSAYLGRDDFRGEVTTPEVPTDRGFWVEQNGQRMFAILIDEPREVPVDINAGQRLQITNAMIRNADFLNNLPGVPITANTRRIAEAQSAFLVVDEEDIEILSRP